MAVRVYICPMVGSGTKQDMFRSKAVDLTAGATTSFVPTKLDGTPGSPWTVTVVRATDFTALDADATCDDLFGGDLPDAIKTREDLLALLRGRTVADVPAVRRNKITATLDKYGVVRTDFVGTTPLWKVMQRVTSSLMERDDNFGSDF